MFLTVILLVPALLGETAGKDMATKDMNNFVESCETGNGKEDGISNCTQILKDGKVVASGYIVDASQSHVAIFDPITRRALVMETTNNVVIGRQLPGKNDH